MVLAHPVLGLAQRLATALWHSGIEYRACSQVKSCMPSNKDRISAQHTRGQVCYTSQRSRQLLSRRERMG